VWALRPRTFASPARGGCTHQQPQPPASRCWSAGPAYQPGGGTAGGRDGVGFRVAAVRLVVVRGNPTAHRAVRRRPPVVWIVPVSTGLGATTNRARVPFGSLPS
jgi:hypothetical protein